MATNSDIPPAEFLKTPKMKRYMRDVIDDTEPLLTEVNQNLSSAALRQVSSRAMNAYREAYAAADKTNILWNEAWHDVMNGREDDLEVIYSAVDAHYVKLNELYEMNGAFVAVIQADLGVKLAAFLAAFAPISTHAKKFGEMRKKLDRMRRDIEKLNKLVKSKAAKTAAGAALTGIGLFIPPMGVLGTLATSLGMMVTGSMVTSTIDNVLGTGSNTTHWQKAHKASETVLTGYNDITKGKVKGLGPLLSLVNISLDTTDTALAGAAKIAIDKQIKSFEKEFERELKAFKTKVEAVEKATKDAKTAYDKALRDASSVRSLSQAA